MAETSQSDHFLLIRAFAEWQDASARVSRPERPITIQGGSYRWCQANGISEPCMNVISGMEFA
jgi:hypothetical protein